MKKQYLENAPVSKGLMDHEMLRPSLAEDDDTVATLLRGLDPVALLS
jgi:hypothetical protein